MKTKKILFLLPLFLGLGRLAVAQDASPGYTPGKWYVGLHYGENNFLSAVRSYQPGLVVGYNLRPRLALQAGLTWVSGIESEWAIPQNYPMGFSGQFFHFTQSGFGVSVPLFLRYLFSQPHRRFQAYALAGAYTSFQSSEFIPVTYQDGQLVSQGEPLTRNHSSFTPTVGAGMRIRTVGRLFLNAELQLYHRRERIPVRRQFGMGLQYEFR